MQFRSVSSSQARRQLVTNLLSSFGLMQRQDVLVGTPLRKGLSGGQKRRVSVASQLVTGPAVLWLDEPTSGLDSTASYEIMSFVRSFAKKYNVSFYFNNAEHSVLTSLKARRHLLDPSTVHFDVQLV